MGICGSKPKIKVNPTFKPDRSYNSSPIMDSKANVYLDEKEEREPHSKSMVEIYIEPDSEGFSSLVPSSHSHHHSMDISSKKNIKQKIYSFSITQKRYFIPLMQNKYYSSPLSLFFEDQKPLELITEYAISSFDYWNATCLHTFEDHWKSVRCLTPLRNGLFASGCRDSTVKIWDSMGACLHTLLGHKAAVISILCLPNEHLASGSIDGSIRIWHPHQMNCIHNLDAHTKAVSSLTYILNKSDDPNDHFMVSSSWDRSIKIWNMQRVRCIRTIVTQATGILCLCTLPSNFIATGSADMHINIWDVINNKKISTIELDPNDYRDETQTSVQIRGVTDRRKSLPGSDDSPILDFRCMALLSNPDRLCCGWGTKIKIWDLQSLKCVMTLSGHMNSVTDLLVLPNDFLASSSQDKTIRIWDTDTGECLKALNEKTHNHSNSITCLCLLDNGWICSGSDDRNIIIWGNSYPKGKQTFQLEEKE